MERPTAPQDLYVMQNEHGLIKVGRSVNPERRRRDLERSEQCRIALVHVLAAQGEREERVHLKLRRHLIEGEWFKGSSASRNAIAKELGLEPDLAWPFLFDRVAAAAWLERFYSWRDDRAVDRLFGRLMTRIKACADHEWIANADIWHLLCVSDTGEQPIVSVQGQGEGVVLEGWQRGAKAPVRVPTYTSDLAACIELWPEDVRPTTWDGPPLECALAALAERRRRLRGSLTTDR